MRTTARALSCLLIAGLACRQASGTTIRVFDLISQFGHAEARPFNGSFQLTGHTFGGRARASIAVPVPSRMTWTLTLPRRSSLRVGVAVSGIRGAASVRFRVGVSDQRIYESLVERVVTSADSAKGWVPLAADLSPYAGPKLSLFYHPDRQTWHIVLAVDAIDGGDAAAFWAEPGIETDTDAARRFFKQHSIP
jgi:hypothetical protein